MSVVGASQGQGVSRDLIVLVEIHNPTGSPLKLSSLEYTLARMGDEDPAFRGKVRLSQTIAPAHTLTVDIHVPLATAAVRGDVLDLRGKLEGYAGDVALSWQIVAKPTVQ